jgi:hypothetical protein
MHHRKETEMNTSQPCLFNALMDDIPTLADEHWRIIDEGDRWRVWFIPTNHPELWRELADFGSEPEAVEFVKSL